MVKILSGPVFCLLLWVSSDYAQPITGQDTEATYPVIGWAYSPGGWGGWGGVCVCVCWGGGGVTHYVRVMDRLPGIDPPLFQGTGKKYRF